MSDTYISGDDLLASLLDTDTPVFEEMPVVAGLRFQIQKFVLHLLLERANTVVSTRSEVMPVLRNFQIQATDGRLRVVATDMELAMIATTELVTVPEPGTAVFPARKLLDIVREAQDGEIDIHVDNRVAHITAGRTTWRLHLEGGEDYPNLPDHTESVLAPVDRQALLRALNTVRYAACKDVNRASLMMIDIRDGKLTASDGPRFQQATLPGFPLAIQLPIGAVADLIKLLQKFDAPEISIGETTHRIIVRLGGDTFSINKLMAAFPDQEAVFLRPALANRHPLSVDRAELLQTIKRVRINADTSTSAIALRLAPGNLTVASRDMHGNEASETIEADWAGPERTVVVNHAYLADLIGAHPGITLRFRLGDDNRTRKSPVLLADEEAGTIGVIQQMLADWVGQ